MPPPTVIREQETYKGWTVLGQVDLDSFVDAHVDTAASFEDNFKAVKAKRREAEKLPETVKVNGYALYNPKATLRHTCTSFSGVKLCAPTFNAAGRASVCGIFLLKFGVAVCVTISMS